ncbi:MAG TPA: hypothetical protein VK120_08770 [Sporosarcina sp.]|nr:hypothetical protein [Sporosarcina sp.]
MNYKLLSLFINGILLIGCYLLLNEGTGFIKWMNAFFYITIFHMIIFLYLFITKGKFFDGIVSSFRKIMTGDANNERKLPSETVSTATYHIAKFNFSFFLFFLLILQFAYFLK